MEVDPKIIKYSLIGGALVLSELYFLLRKSKHSYTLTRDYAIDAEELFDYLSDPSHYYSLNQKTAVTGIDDSTPQKINDFAPFYPFKVNVNRTSQGKRSPYNFQLECKAMCCNLNINWEITAKGSKDSTVTVIVDIEGPWVDVNLMKLSQNQMIKKLDGISTVLVK